jgi:hypothetical protein
VHEQQREQRALLLAAERDRAVVADDLERAEDPKLEQVLLVTPKANGA